MSRIKEIKSRIKSVKDVQQITRAMKMVSAAKLRKVEEKFHKSTQYLNELEKILKFMMGKNSTVKSFMMKESGRSEKVGLALIASDKGLCGGFTANVSKRILKESKSFQKDQLVYLSIGKKGRVVLKREKIEPLYSEKDIFGKLTYTDASRIASKLVQGFLDGEYGSLYMGYNRFKAKDGEPVAFKKILPLEFEAEPNDQELDYLYEEDSLEVSMELFVEYYFTQLVFHSLIESEASEFLARMQAMDAASDNASELINKLKLEYNRARQAAITKEILDIVGGAEALKS